MVTSSAVVGSSAMSRSGSFASAMAIITRCRWPPESWCGYARKPALPRRGCRLSRKSVERPLPGRAVRHAAVDFQDLAHLRLDRMQRIERGHRLLENDGDAGCRERAGSRIPWRAAGPCLQAGSRPWGDARPDPFPPACSAPSTCSPWRANEPLRCRHSSVSPRLDSETWAFSKRKGPRSLLFGCALLTLVTATAHAAPKTIFVNDFGAKGDSTTLDSAAIQKAIDKAAPKKEIVSFKPGTYLTGAIFLKSGVTLDIPEGVTLTGSQHIEDYPEHATRIAGIEMTWPTAMINIRDAHDVTLTGKGTIDGNGAVWWKVYNDLRARVHAQGPALGLGLRRQARAAHR